MRLKKELIPDVRVLPYNLADSLLALPSKPTSPILLLITGISILLGTMVQAFSLSNVGSCRWPRLESKIVDRSEDCPRVELSGKPRGPHLAFSFLVGAGSSLSIAAAVVERESVNDALEAWDVGAGASVGLEARVGVLSHCKSCGPLLSLALFFPHISLPRPDTLVLIGVRRCARLQISRQS